MRILSISLLAGCSLTTYDYATCATGAECREAFGFGYTCGDAGLCAPIEVEPRCESAWPVDLFQRIENYRDAIVLGSLFDHTSDTPETQAARLAVMQVNDLSGLDGRTYAIVECTYEENNDYDDRDLIEATSFTTAWLADTLGVPAIIGPATSSAAEAAYAIAAPADTVLLSPSATSPSLSTIDGLTKTDAEPGLFWRTAPPDSLQGKVVAEDMMKRSSDVAVIYGSGSYGEGLAQVFQTEFEVGGGEVTLYPFGDDTERDLAVRNVATAQPDEVLFISAEGTDVAAFLNAAVVLAPYELMPIFLTDSARDDDVLDLASSASDLFDQVRGTAPSVPKGTVYDFFSVAYSGAFAPAAASDSVYTAHTWDASWLAIYGVAWSAANEGGITGTGIARGLRQVSAGTDVPIDPTSWSQVQASFDEASPIDVSGASGSLDFDPDTEETTASIDVWTIVDGSFVTVGTTEP
ncbi:MAG: ABC transporter substrate-binding protein [Pseudomonadota bacterium]|nr:ABC transporter substrate-binding protein [Pseudomonadota bacterium]